MPDQLSTSRVRIRRHPSVSLELLATIFVVASVLCTPMTPARADWMSYSGAENAPNIAEIYIEADSIRIELEIYIGDLVDFDRLLPERFFEGTGIERPPLEERMRKFSAEDLQIITDDGRTLQAERRVVAERTRKPRPSPNVGKLNPITLQPIPGPPSDDRVLYVELVYALGPAPESLILVPPTEGQGRPTATVGFIVYHGGVPLIDFRYMPMESTLHLDWDDPWYSEFEERALKRWQRGSVLSYLYIEPFEVRHEILTRVRDLEPWLDLGLRGDEFIEADENDELKQRVGEFFLEQENLVIDGKRLRPILDRMAFIKYSMTGSIFLDQPERLSLNTAVVGVILTYLTGEMPQQVEYDWNLWSDRVQKIPTDAIDPAGGFPSDLTPDDNRAVWKNFLKTYQPPTVARVAIDSALTTWTLPLGSALCLIALLYLAALILRHHRAGRSVAIPGGLALVCLAGTILLQPHFGVEVSRPAVTAQKPSPEEA